MKDFQPDYNNMILAATNRRPNRMPIYEHGIGWGTISTVLNKDILPYWTGKTDDIREFLRLYAQFYRQTGYDVMNWDHNIGSYMPGSGALLGGHDGAIKDRADFEKYPWDEVAVRFFEDTTKYFNLLGEILPPGMKAMGGPGNGIYECVVDITGYMNLCYISADDPELYADLFRKVGEVNYGIWKTFLERYADQYAVCRFGDDLGFRSGTLISPDDIKKHVVPQYRKIVELIHSHGKPFLYHSCGKNFNVMDEIIDVAKIDAKHSNEDAIAPFTEWVERYGDRIGNFGGIDVDMLCRSSAQDIKAYARDLIERVSALKDNRGFALGSGNSIPDYVPVEGYLAMVEAAREARGD